MRDEKPVEIRVELVPQKSHFPTLCHARLGSKAGEGKVYSGEKPEVKFSIFLDFLFLERGRGCYDGIGDVKHRCIFRPSQNWRCSRFPANSTPFPSIGPFERGSRMVKRTQLGSKLEESHWNHKGGRRRLF